MPTAKQKMLLLPSCNTVTTWQMALHMGNVFGLPLRIFVCVQRLAIVMVSVTGLVIWLNKHRATVFNRNRMLQRQPQ